MVADIYLTTLDRIEGKVDAVNNSVNDLADRVTQIEVSIETNKLETEQRFVTKEEYETDRETDAKKRRGLYAAIATVLGGAVTAIAQWVTI